MKTQNFNRNETRTSLPRNKISRTPLTQRFDKSTIAGSLNANYDSDSTPETSPTTKSKKTNKLLEELGFLSNSSNRPYLVYLQKNRKLLKRPTIGLADFWTFKEKFEFLKNGGHWEAYKKLLYQKHMHEFGCKKNERNPSSPYMMDLNARKRVMKLIDTSDSERKIKNRSMMRLTTSRVSPISLNSNDKSTNLEKIVVKCEDLANENQNEIHSAMQTQQSFFQKLLKKHSLKKRNISKFELNRIHATVKSFPK